VSSVSITLATRDYDYVSPLGMDDVKVEGVNLTLLRVFEAIERVVGDPSIHGGEASFSRYIQRVASGDTSFVGLPVFLVREFRHRCFFVALESNITEVSQLAGKRVGTDSWPASGNTWSRAILRERGISLDSVRWVVGPVDPGDASPQPDPLPGGVAPAPPGRSLSQLLVSGELDAIMCPWPPKQFYGKGSRVRRLYVDYRTAERDYYRRTGIFPAEHILMIRRAHVEQAPWILRNIYTAFEQARKRSEENHWVNHETSAWLLADMEEQAALMGEDFQPYGYVANREMVAAFCEEQFAQGLIREPLDPDLVFHDFEQLGP